MIPILYMRTDRDFTSNGIGRLTEATSCIVTEVRNGEYELELVYPITGKYYSWIKEGRIIAATHDDHGDRQLFKVYRHSAPINGLVTFYAHHISYELNNIILDPIEETTSAGAVFSRMEHSTTPENPFTMWTVVSTSGTFSTDVPMPVRAALGGVRGSVLDVFGGEYEWDNFTVRMHAQRGTNSGITVRYGKNLTDITQTYDELGIYNAVIPYWYQDGTLVVLPEKYVAQQGAASLVYAALDLTQEFQDPPEVEDLRSRAASLLTSNRPWVPKENIKIKFLQLWQTEEYKEVAALQRLSLCDRVNVYYPELGVEVENVEIIKVVYNVLLDRYDEMELGEAKSTLSQALTDPFREEVEGIVQNYPTKSTMQAAIDEATKAITGGGGGVFRWGFNANGQPIELAVLDTGDKDTAVNVWRWNDAGLGHSGNGYDGPYDDFAILANGSINASAIRTGSMSASMIRGGTLDLGGTTASTSYGDGSIHLYDSNDVQIGTIDKNGVSTSALIASDYVNISGNKQSYFKTPFGNIDGQYIELSQQGFQLVTPTSVLKNKTTNYGSYYGNIAGIGMSYTEYVNQSWDVSIDPMALKYDMKYNNGEDYTRFWVEDDRLQYIIYEAGSRFGFYVDSHASPELRFYGNATFEGSLSVYGTKPRLVKTKDYDRRLLYCYETPTPYFGDIGEGITGADGLCYVPVDPVFAETVNLSTYQVFVQAYGEDPVCVVSRTPGHFVVKGMPGTIFAWELKAKQADYDQLRLDKQEEKINTRNGIDYGTDAIKHINRIKEERTA